ncbi:MAG: hypothetical protein VB078_04285 [Clostridiaceae bacterium]|nr:hypothetical protein [Clostridiaceae bacterium]
MDRFNMSSDPAWSLFPYTFSFPLIMRSDIPKEFTGRQYADDLADSLYMLDFEYFLPPFR